MTVKTARAGQPPRCRACVIVGVPVASQKVQVSGLARLAVTPLQKALDPASGVGA